MEFIEGKIKTFLDVNLLGSNRKLLWVNPDCGLKTREWSQVPPSTRTLLLTYIDADWSQNYFEGRKLLHTLCTRLDQEGALIHQLKNV